MNKKNPDHIDFKDPYHIAGLVILAGAIAVLIYQNDSFYLKLLGIVLLAVGVLLLRLKAAWAEGKEIEKNLVKEGFNNIPKWQQWLFSILIILSLGAVMWFHLPAYTGYLVIALWISIFVLISRYYKYKNKNLHEVK